MNTRSAAWQSFLVLFAVKSTETNTDRVFASFFGKKEEKTNSMAELFGTFCGKKHQYYLRLESNLYGN
ncbi:MAG: hypothetical protein Q7T54_02755 [Candidatus Levybacteria bacterium]|nr:hypothetical protein [Candidatus Levybacteria bacterium]